AERLAHVDERPAPERLIARPLAREGTDRRGHGALEVLARCVGTAREGRARRRVDDLEVPAARDELAVDQMREGRLHGRGHYARLPAAARTSRQRARLASHGIFTVIAAVLSRARARRNDGARRQGTTPSAGATPRPGRRSRAEGAVLVHGGSLRRPIPRRPTRSIGSSTVSRRRPAAASRGSPPRPQAAGLRAAWCPWHRSASRDPSPRSGSSRAPAVRRRERRRRYGTALAAAERRGAAERPSCLLLRPEAGAKRAQ